MILTIVILSFVLLFVLAYMLFVLLDSRKIFLEKQIAERERDNMSENYFRIQKQWQHINAASNKNSIIYCVGFAFNEDKSKVMLIRRSKPDWQKGKLNGIGGKVLRSESQFEGMQREFVEQAGIPTPMSDWKMYCTLHGEDYILYCFAIKLGKYVNALQSGGDIGWYNVEDVSNWMPSNQLIHNVPWLVGMALDSRVQYANVKAE